MRNGAVGKVCPGVAVVERTPREHLTTSRMDIQSEVGSRVRQGKPRGQPFASWCQRYLLATRLVLAMEGMKYFTG